MRGACLDTGTPACDDGMAMRLSSPFSLVRRAFRLFFTPRNFILYLGIGILPLGVLLVCVAAASVILPMFAPFVASLFPGGRAEAGTVLMLLSGGVLAAFALYYIGSFYSATLYQLHFAVANGGDIHVRELLRNGWRLAGHLLVVSLLLGLIILLGFILLIIPGFIFMVWFTFTTIIAVIEPSDTDPFKSSKVMISGRFWPVVGRLVLFSMLSIIPYTILREISPIAGTLWSLTSPFFGLLLMLLYIDVKQASVPG